MVKKWINSRLTYRAILFLLTLISFLSILLFLLFFTAYAPNNYTLGVSVESSPKPIVDIVFAILLLINDICVILSFLECIRVCYHILCKQQFTWVQAKSIMISLYPVMIIAFLSGWDFSTFVQYLTSPLHILFNF